MAPPLVHNFNASPPCVRQMIMRSFAFHNGKRKGYEIVIWAY